MTYNPDYDRPGKHGAGQGDYSGQYDSKPVSGRWLMIALVFILALFAAALFFSGGSTVTVNESDPALPAATETPQPAPATPVTE